MKTKSQNGFALAVLLVTLTVVSVLIVTVTSQTISNHQSASKERYRVNAQLSADSGLDRAFIELTDDEDWAGTGGQVELYSNATFKTTYEVTISPGSSAEHRIIRSIGRTFEPVTATTAKATRIFEVEAEAVTTGTGPASVVTGVGGLILNNNSRISGGDVVVNGTILVNNNAQIGLSNNPVNVRAAHKSCPTPVNSTYPQVCTSGQPITANGRIYGNVQAQNQTNGTNMSNPGLVSNSFGAITIPGYDRPAHKAALQNPVLSPTPLSANPSQSGYAPNNSAVACNKTWPANVKITGNVTLSNNCTVTLVGSVWITGNLSIGNNARIIVSNTLGATRPVMMVDGSTGITFGNNAVVTPNSSGTGVEFISTWWNTNTATNGNFNCGGIADPLDCTNVTGLALSTSQTTTTLNFSNNSTASGSVLRTLWSRVSISNNGAIGAVQGQTIQLGNNAVINFTASIDGSDNLVTTWVKRGYLRVFQ